MIAGIASGIVDTLDNASIALSTLSPAISKVVDAHLPLIEQRVFERRLKICYRHCKRQKFNADKIKAMVDLDFDDQTDTKKQEITSVLNAQLLKPKA